MWHENNHEGNINLLHGTRGLHTGGASSCHATVNGSKSTTNTTDADRSAIIISLPKIIRICNEYITKTHSQTGTLFTSCSNVIVIHFLINRFGSRKRFGKDSSNAAKEQNHKVLLLFSSYLRSSYRNYWIHLLIWRHLFWNMLWLSQIIKYFIFLFVCFFFFTTYSLFFTFF
jgi:hypothetical protein